MKTVSEVVGVKPNLFVLRLARKACSLLRNKEEEKIVNIDGKAVEFLSIEEKAHSTLNDESKQIKAEVSVDNKHYDLTVKVTQFNNTSFSVINSYGLTERKNNEPF